MHKCDKTRFLPLTVAQASYLAGQPVNPHHKNISCMLEVPAMLDITLLQRAMRYVQMQHESLLLRFTHDAAEWRQYVIHAYDEIPFTHIDLSAYPLPVQQQMIEQDLTKLQASLNLFEGPVWRVVHFHRGSSRPGRVLLLINHLVVDGFSFPIVLADLQSVYQQLCNGQPVRLPPVPTSFSSCVRQQMEYAQSNGFKQDLDYWLHQPWDSTARFPSDFPCVDNVHNSIAFQQEISTSLSREETQTLLRKVTSAYKVHMLEILLLALAKAFVPWVGARALHLALVLNGRNTYEIFAQTSLAHLDVTRTVGYLPYAVEHLVLDPGQGGTTAEELQAIQAQFRRMPHQGLSSPGLRYLCQDETIVQAMRSLPVYELLFNYLGLQDNHSPSDIPLFSAVPEAPGPSQDPRNPRRSLLICQAAVIDQQLITSWEYNGHIHRRETIEALIHTYSDTLHALIDMCTLS